MSEPKFTKGPWVIDSATRPAEVCTIHGLPESETDGQGFAYVRGALGYWDAEEEENMANAHLIAAAPELYEALQNLLSRLANDADGHAWFMDEQEASIIALAKARGES